MELRFTIITGDGISIRMSTIREESKSAFRSAQVVDLAKVREKRKCKRCDGIGIMAVEVPLESFTDCMGIEGRTCTKCGGKGFT